MYKFNNTSVVTADETVLLSVEKGENKHKTYVLNKDFDATDIYFDEEYIDLLTKLVNARRMDLLENILPLNDKYQFMKAIIISGNVPAFIKYKHTEFECIGMRKKLDNAILFRMAFENGSIPILNYLFHPSHNEITTKQLGNIIFNIDSECSIKKSLQSLTWLMDNGHIPIDFRYKDQSVLEYLLKLQSYDYITDKDSIDSMTKYINNKSN